MSLDHLRDWIGRTERREDEITATPIAALSATLDRDDPPPVPGSDLPPLWHWMYFNPIAAPERTRRRRSSAARRLSAAGANCRAGCGPVAGSSSTIRLRVGDEVTRESRIADVKVKQGRSGRLVFVTVRHEVTNARGLALSEEHDIVYRDAPVPGAAVPPPEAAPADATFSRELQGDPVMLFRYSALTFNGHRIHYDRSYVTEVEGYPGLIVHGPLIATLLLDLLRRERPQAQVRRFAFTAQRPVFDIHRFSVCGRPDGERRFRLWTRDHEGWLTMQASAELA